MKFSAVLLSAASVALVAASATTAAPATTQLTYTPEQQKCLDDCGSNLNCQAECLGAPAPNSSMLVQVHDCYAKCDHGDGSPAATEKFAKCGQACISEHYYASTLGSGPKTAGGNAPASSAVVTSTATDGKVVTATQATTPQATDGSSAASPIPSQGAAQPVHVGGSMAGIFAVVAAVFAL